MNVGALCTRPVHTVEAEDTIREAAGKMVEHHVGTLVVVDQDRRPRGIVTDRDIVTRCVAKDYSPDSSTVGQVMTRPVETVPDTMSVDHALRTMADAEMRRVVVTGDGGRAIGVLALDDVLMKHVRETEEIGRLLRAQIPV